MTTEQKRIMARVEELLRWCDTLEAQLDQIHPQPHLASWTLQVVEIERSL